MAPMFETLFLQLVQLYGEIFGNCSIRLSNDWNHFYETTDHLQQFRADNFSTFFKSEAFTFSSASSIKFIQVWPETLQHIEVFAPFLFIAFARKWFLSFGFLSSSDPFSYFSYSDSHSCVVVFLIKQLFFSGLLDMFSALRASLVASHFISSAPL